MDGNLDIELLEVAGFEAAFQAMREPMKGRDNSKTYTREQDLELSKRLIAKGDDHAKHMRLCFVWLSMRAPRYFWSEFDTYRIGVEKESGSTIHRLMQDGLDCHRDCVPCFPDNPNRLSDTYLFAQGEINHLCKLWREAETAEERNDYLNMAKKILPEGYLQTRVVCISYQTLRRIYLQRQTHRLQEWQEFCHFVETLPYAELVMLDKYKETADEQKEETSL